jgi:hypothetical protein
VETEHETRAAQRESALQRWADDGGFIPEPQHPVAPGTRRSPWRAIGIAAACGFAIGWLTSPGSRGGR